MVVKRYPKLIERNNIKHHSLCWVKDGGSSALSTSQALQCHSAVPVLNVLSSKGAFPGRCQSEMSLLGMIDNRQKITRHDRSPEKELARVNIVSRASLAALSAHEVSCYFLGLRWSKLCATGSGRVCEG